MPTAKRVDRQSGHAPRSFLRHVEEHGIALRQRAGLGPQDRLDPFAQQAVFDIVVVDPRSLESLDAADHENLRDIDARTWSGSGQPLPDGRLLVLFNPNQTPERAAVTVMEEVAHAHFGHHPSTLVVEPTGLVGRHYDAVAEDEAYWTAAAALLPSAVVARAVWNGVPVGALAAEYGVSAELVEFRIKTLRLWPWYRKRRVAA